MSFRCGKCGRAAQDREKPVVRASGTRVKTYPRRECAQSVPNQHRHKWRADHGGVGNESTGQVNICPRCITTE